MVRYCDDCPWNYSEPYTESWGCMLFGEECKKCEKFDEEVGGCYYSQKKLERMAYARNKKCNHAQKIAESYSPGIKIYFKDHDSYTPNRKGGHRHKHIRNAHKRMRKCKECGDPIVKGMEARIEIPLVRGCDDTMCRCCLRMLDEEIYHHNYGTVKEIEMMEADLYCR